MISTENFRVPAHPRGFSSLLQSRKNSSSSDRGAIPLLCLEKKRNLWRFFDARTYRSGPFDEEYLISLMEQLI